MTDYGRGDVLSARAEREIDEAEKAQREDMQATEDAEHAVQVMLHDDPEVLMSAFHNNATDADLDAMDAALIEYLKGVKEGEESPFYDAVVRIVKESQE